MIMPLLESEDNEHMVGSRPFLRHNSAVLATLSSTYDCGPGQFALEAHRDLAERVTLHDAPKRAKE